MPDYLKFKGVTNLATSLLTERLLRSTKMYLDWSFLGIGGFVNVANPSSTINSGNLNKLSPVTDPSLPAGKIWQASKMEWVYETNPNITTAIPNGVSVKVDGTTVVASDPTNGYYIDYPLGRIIFNTALTSSRVVTAQYSYRWIATSIFSDNPWFRELQKKSFNVESAQFMQSSKGEWSILGSNRVQMPHVVIQQVPVGSATGLELGSGNLKMTRNILFHIFAETDWERDKIIDILSYQQSGAYYLLDIDSIARNSDYPLTYKGALVNSPKTYSQLTETYKWKQTYITSAKISELQFPNIYTGIVRWTVEIDGLAC